VNGRAWRREIAARGTSSLTLVGKARHLGSSDSISSDPLMTVNFRTADLQAPAGLAADPARASRHAALANMTDAVAFPLTLAALVLIYGLLQNPYWVPSGDSEVYISIARNLARGDGYTFNGQPVAMVPPGWPVLMAGVMKIAPYFLPLKLLVMGCMIGFFACGYWIARRFVTPPRAAGVILLTAILSVVYPATYWLISEGSFCLLSAASLLLALQINEGKQAWWRIILLALVCAGAVTVRWAGIIGMLLVAAALLRGPIRFQWSRRWTALLLSAALTGATFIGLREGLRVTRKQAEAAQEFGGAAEDTGAPVIVDKQIATQYKIVTGTAGSATYPQRVINWGRWLSFLYWQPFRAAAASHALSLACNALGWILLGLITLTAVVDARRGECLWLALLAYSGALALNWPIANARYLVPVSFLLTLGVLRGADELRARMADPLWRSGFAAGIGAFTAVFLYCGLSTLMRASRRDEVEQYVLPVLFVAGAVLVFWLTQRYALWRELPWPRVVHWCAVAFVAGVVLCNGALYGLEVSVERSRDLYASYEAGLNQNLIAAAKYFNARGVKDGQISVSSRYQNLGRTRSSPFGLRAMTMLTGRSIVSVPWQRIAPPNPRLRSWLNNQKIEWYLYQPPVSPWRVGHLRMGWWEARVTGIPPVGDKAGWRLYRVDDEKMPEVQLPPVHGWPTRVPGL
jgi:hypothetical protein